MDFKNPVVISDKQIFSEKQLREWTATYSVDERVSIIDAILGFFKGVTKGEAEEQPESASVSLSVLETETAKFVKGAIDARSFKAVLKAAFGNNLKNVLPDILANLPEEKAVELKKV